MKKKRASDGAIARALWKFVVNHKLPEMNFGGNERRGLWLNMFLEENYSHIYQEAKIEDDRRN